VLLLLLLLPQQHEPDGHTKEEARA